MASKSQQLNATGQPYPEDACVAQLVGEQAEATPDALAVEAGTESLTYRELDTRANELARHLRSLGVGADVLAGLCVGRSAAMVVGALGILKAGGAYVPLDPSYPPERLSFMLADSGAKVVVTQGCIADRLPAGPWKVVGVDARDCETEPYSAETSGTGLAYVIYTSGSTGQPKGVEITNRSLMNLVFWHRDAFQVSGRDRATQLASPGFDAAVWELWPYLTAGASIHIPDEATRVSPERLRDWLVARRITISFLPTPLAERALKLEWPPETSLRYLLTGGDTLHHYPSPNLPFKVVNNYGPTECTVVATSCVVPPREDSDSLPPIGRAIANTEVYILDEHLRRVPAGEAGEIYIGGDGLARGYLNRPELTAERFVPNPFNAGQQARLYRTGDLARYLPDGQIAFLGRSDDQVKIRGNRVELSEIAGVLERHPSVQSSAVVASGDRGGEKRLIAYVVAAPEHSPDAAGLQELLRQRLPEYMMPSAFVLVDSLPMTPNGKVNPAALPPPTEENTLRSDAFVAPRNPLEERLGAIVATLLGLERVSVNGNFFLLGGHSLLGTQLIARISDTFGVDLPLRTLFESPTVAQLSAEIEKLIVAKIQAMPDDKVQEMLNRGPATEKAGSL